MTFYNRIECIVNSGFIGITDYKEFNILAVSAMRKSFESFVSATLGPGLYNWISESWVIQYRNKLNLKPNGLYSK